MKSFRRFVAAAVVTALTTLVVAGTASATELTNGSGMVTTGSTIASAAEGTTTLHPPIGDISCTGSEVEGTTSNTGGSSETVSSSLSKLSFTGCNAEVVVLTKGSLEVHGLSSNNATLTSSGAQVTVTFVGFHCIFATSSTDIGTLTGSATTGATATLDIAATIPRTGGRSGAFCGSTASWTGSYKFTSPDTLNIDGGGGGGGKTSTTTTTSLSGESKTGAEITVNEGSKVKDQATLSGTNAGKATGTVKYKVYADKECKELVTSAGEVTVSAGSVPSSEEKALEAGRVYYWQAEYAGDSSNEASKSSCGGEILTVKASTTLTTSLSGESKTGEEITVNEGSNAKDTATLSGTRSSSATGKVKFKAYKDKECKELASEAGEGSLSEGKATSEEKSLEAAAVYYWQAEYAGDSLHQTSTSTCGKEVLTIKAKTSISTTLSAEEEELIEGAEITVYEGTPVQDTATLSGTRSSSATGGVQYNVYADSECEELVAGAGEASVEAGVAGSSSEVELTEGTYYWQAEYSGDALHQESKSTCGVEVLVVVVRAFRTNANPAAVVGSQIEEQVFKFGAGNQVKCKKAQYAAGPIVGLATVSLRVDPIYLECTGLGGFPTEEVRPEGCEWELKVRQRRPGGFKDKTFLKCPVGQNLKVLAANNLGVVQCEVLVTREQEAQFFEFENNEVFGQKLLRVTPNLTNLSYDVTKKEAGCALPAVANNYVNGILIGKFKLEVEGANLLIG